MSAEPQARWCIVPAVDHGWMGLIPDYIFGTDGIMGYSGKLVSPDVLSSFKGLVNQNPDVEMWYLVRIFGTLEALNGITGNKDVASLGNNPQAVDNILSNVLPEVETDDWDDKFFVR